MLAVACRFMCGIGHYWRRRPAGLKKQFWGFGHTQICVIFPRTKVMGGIMPFSPGFNLSEALDLVTLCAIIEGQTLIPVPAGWTKIFESPQISYFTEKWQLW